MVGVLKTIVWVISETNKVAIFCHNDELSSSLS